MKQVAKLSGGKIATIAELHGLGGATALRKRRGRAVTERVAGLIT